MTIIYRAGSQAVKVKAMMWLSLAAAAATCWWGWGLFRTYGSNAADGGALAPFVTRLGLGLGVAILGLAFAFGMWAYGRVYVRELWSDEGEGGLRARTTGFFADRELRLRASDVLGSNYRAGQFDNPDGVSVNAPWISLRIAGRRWPLIIDAQGEFPDRALAARVLKLG